MTGLTLTGKRRRSAAFGTSNQPDGTTITAPLGTVSAIPPPPTPAANHRSVTVPAANVLRCEASYTVTASVTRYGRQQREQAITRWVGSAAGVTINAVATDGVVTPRKWRLAQTLSGK